jgi:hypothetical protein
MTRWGNFAPRDGSTGSERLEKSKLYFPAQRIPAVPTVFLWFWPCFIQLHFSVLRPVGPFCGFLMEH